MKAGSPYAALLVLSGCVAAPAGIDPLRGGLGADLVETADSAWTADDGVLQPARGAGMTYVVTRQRFADVDIRLEVYPAAGTNSGVFARCQDPADINPTQCYEFNIWDAHPEQQWRTGAIVTIASPVADVVTEERWNSMRVRLEGSRLRVWINGTLTNDIEDNRLAEGHIAFQYGGEDGMVRFRNIRIAALP